MSFVAYNDTAVSGDWHIIARVWRDAAHAVPANAEAGTTILEASKDVPRDVGDAAIGWYVDITNGSLSDGPPVSTSAATQRNEIKSIITQEWKLFDRSLFANVDSNTRPIFATVAKRTQYLIAALAINTSDAALDILKTEARKTLYDFAYYADMSAWASAYDGGSFYVFEKGTSEDSVALPSASSGIVVPSVAQVNAVSIAQELA